MQVSLSAFVLLEWRIVAEQGSECLLVNCAIIALSIAISLHLLSLAVDRVLAERLSYSKYSQLSQGKILFYISSHSPSPQFLTHFILACFSLNNFVSGEAFSNESGNG